MRIRAFRDYILAKEIKGFAAVMPQNLLSLMLYTLSRTAHHTSSVFSPVLRMFSLTPYWRYGVINQEKAGDKMTTEVRKKDEESAMCLKHSLCCLMTGS